MSYKVYKGYKIGKGIGLLLILCFMGFTQLSWGQGKEFVKKNFKDNPKGYRKAMDSIKKGDSYYIRGSHFYRNAIPYYLSAENFNPDDAMLNYKIGKCMVYSSYKKRATTYLEKAIQLNPVIAVDVHYYLGRAYHLNMDWEKAKQEYNTYLQSLTVDKVTEINDVRKKIEECNNGKLLCQTPIRVHIDNLGAAINTKYSEYGPLISSNDSEIIFTSRAAPLSPKAKTDPIDGESFEHLFVSYYKKGEWTPSVSMGSPLNNKSHDATAGLSPDGQTLYIYRVKNNGDIYASHIINAKWAKPKRMSHLINSVGKESSASITADGKILYFTSDRPGGYGRGDIYKSTLDDKGRWTIAQNLGPSINTLYDEESVFIQPDGKTLYFSSLGHNTMGGYDIFKSSFDNGQWSAPENLGYPINTPDDDAFFVMPANTKHAYYSSSQQGGTGEMDIYMITFLGPEKPVVISTTPNTLSGITSNIADVMTNEAVSVAVSNKALLTGIVVDSETHKPLLASVELVDNKKNKVVADITTDSTTGKYSITLSSGINYGIAVKANNYLFYSANVDLTDSSHYREIQKNITLQALAVGSHMALRNIFFDYNKSTLRKESTPEIQRVIDLLKQYPTITVEIAGYTDNKGGATYNLNLSAARAKSVVTYLVAHGIGAKRLTSKGYGSANPVADNTTDEGRQMNRRTEFKITGR